MPVETAKVNLVRLSLAPSPTEQEKAVRTHRLIREHLETDPSLKKYYVDTFLQGSYKNSTNVRADSDVDMGALTSQVYYPDTDFLPKTAASPHEKSQAVLYEEARIPGDFTFWEYRDAVLASLVAKYGDSSIDDGNKAIRVIGNTNRLDADVLPCILHRLYWRFTGKASDYSEGICFYTKQNKFVVNFPKQHFDNLTDKNTATGGKLKGTIRILKRIRNLMDEKGKWDRKRSPSFYLESLVWNVPSHIFEDDYETVVRDVLRFLYNDLSEKKANGDLNEYMQANAIFFLFHPTFWNVDDALAFIEAVWAHIFIDG